MIVQLIKKNTCKSMLEICTYVKSSMTLDLLGHMYKLVETHCVGYVQICDGQVDKLHNEFIITMDICDYRRQMTKCNCAVNENICTHVKINTKLT